MLLDDDNDGTSDFLDDEEIQKEEQFLEEEVAFDPPYRGMIHHGGYRVTDIYIDNTEFSNAIINHNKMVTHAIQQGKTAPVMSDYLGWCFITLATRLSRSHRFSRYTWRDEMISDAIVDCIKAVKNFNPATKTRTGSVNAFSYFTMIAYYAFVRRIKKEKALLDVRDKVQEEFFYSQTTTPSDFFDE